MNTHQLKKLFVPSINETHEMTDRFFAATIAVQFVAIIAGLVIADTISKKLGNSLAN